MKLRHFLAALAVASPVPAMAAGEILRCVAPGGAITYQQVPCPESALSEQPRIATDYPEPNRAERERLLAREAELHRRLEAQRDRLTQEAAMREAREERRHEREMLAASQPAEPVYWVAQPWQAWRPRHSQARSHSQPRPFPYWR